MIKEKACVCGNHIYTIVTVLLCVWVCARAHCSMCGLTTQSLLVNAFVPPYFPPSPTRFVSLHGFLREGLMYDICLTGIGLGSCGTWKHISTICFFYALGIWLEGWGCREGRETWFVLKCR